MKKLWRGVIGSLAALLLASASLPSATVAAAESIDAKAALAIDAKSGQVLYAQNATTKLPIASMTKMLSLYLVLEAVRDGKLSWDATFTPDKTIYNISQDHNLSNVPMREDGKYTVKELYEASWIYSANGAMMLLANAVAGSQAKFVELMQAKLKQWGVTDATIVNVTGLNNVELKADRVPGTAPDAENAMTAEQISLVAKHLLSDFPEVLDTTRIKEKTFQEGTSDAIKMPTYNWMLPGGIAAQADLPVDGLKTGTTDLAGESFTGTVAKDGMRLITVVMHANGNGDTKRFVQTAKLMRQTLSDFRPVRMTTKGQAVRQHASVAVTRGVDATAPVAATRSLTVMVPANGTAKLNYRAVKKSLDAPTKANVTVGQVEPTINGQPVRFVDGKKLSVPVATTQAVKKANFFVLIGRGIKQFFEDLF